MVIVGQGGIRPDDIFVFVSPVTQSSNVKCFLKNRGFFDRKGIQNSMGQKDSPAQVTLLHCSWAGNHLRGEPEELSTLQRL